MDMYMRVVGPDATVVRELEKKIQDQDIEQ